MKYGNRGNAGCGLEDVEEVMKEAICFKKGVKNYGEYCTVQELRQADYVHQNEVWKEYAGRYHIREL